MDSILILNRCYKKVFQNYRLLILLSVFYKVLANITSASLDFHQPNQQARFCKGYSTMDDIHTINLVIENCGEYKKPVFIAFIYYGKAFDSHETSALIQALRSKGANEHCVRILEKSTVGPQLQSSFIRRAVKYPKRSAFQSL